MSSSTPNLNLVLPVGSEHVSRAIINENNTKIDTGFGTLSEQIKINSMTSTNLNDYGGSTDHVEYYTANNISTFTNIPNALVSSAYPFVLEVIKFQYYTKQILHIFNSSLTEHITYIRQKTYANGEIAWGNWNSYALNSKIANKNTSFPVSYGGVSSTAYLEKTGNVVELRLSLGNGNAFSSATGFDEIGTLPQGYRPYNGNITLACIARDKGTWTTANYCVFVLYIYATGAVEVRGNATQMKSMQYITLDVTYIAEE